MEGWHSRGYMPHIETGEIPQLISYHVAGSLPKSVVNGWNEQLQYENDQEKRFKIRLRIERYLDEGHNHLFLTNSEIGSLVENAFGYFDGQQYRLHAWVVMPNHVHVLITILPGYQLSRIVGSWKSFTAHEIKKIVSIEGSVWQIEYWDRFIRNERHYQNAISYVHTNPVKAGLCVCAEDWPFSSARQYLHKQIGEV